MANFKDLTNQRFGRLKVEKLDKKVKSGKRYRYYWDCKCDCGNHISARTDELTSGNTRSCGCLKKEQDKINLTANHRHKLSGTKLYRLYQGMRKRCENPKNKRYKDYGGRGITVCKEWVESNDKFFEWALSHGYKEGLQIDRIDNEKGYSPNNCRFITQKENCRNRRSNLMIPLADGSYITFVEFAERLGLDYEVAYHKFRHLGIKRKDLEISKHRANQSDSEKAG